MLGALLHWERRIKAKAARGWILQLVQSRDKSSRSAMATTHYRTRVLREALKPWIELWQVMRSKGRIISTICIIDG